MVSDDIIAEPKLNVEPQPNLPLLRKVLDHIDAHPDEWQQAYWGQQTSQNTCGTAYCVAGHAIVMSGQHEVTLTADRWGPVMLVDGNEYIDDEFGNETESASLAGRQVLGLSNAEARQLFRGRNTREEVQRAATAIAARAGERL